jgi:hypothetical protein
MGTAIGRATVGLLLLVTATAGCGESAEHHFLKHALAPLRLQIDQQKSQIGDSLKQVQSGDPAALRVARYEVAEMGSTVRRLAALHAPSSVTAQQRAYVRANARVVASLRGFTAAVSSGRTAAIDPAATRAQQAIGASVQADVALQAALRR